MAVQKVYEAVFHSRVGDSYRATIYDLDYTAGAAMTSLYGEPQANLPIELTVLHETPEIKWDAEPSTIAQPIVGSSFEMGILLLADDTNKIKDVIKDRPEHTLAVEVERHNGTTNSLTLASNWDVIWRGVLVHEAIQYSWSDYPQEINLVFTDGLSLLRDKAYIDSSGDAYSSNGNRFAILRKQIGRCLNELPHNALWGEQELYFTEQLDMFHWNQMDDSGSPTVIGSVLNHSGCNQDLWYEVREHKSPYNRDSIIRAGGSTCYEIITDIMVAFGCTLHHSGGIFQAISPFLINDDTVYIGQRRWRADKRTMLDSSYQNSAYTQASGDADGTDYPNHLDYRDPEKVLMGSSLSYMPAARGTFMTHLKGGAPFAFNPTHPVRIIGQVVNAAEGPSNPNPGQYNPYAGGQVGAGSGFSNFVAGPTFPLNNTTTLAPGGESLRIQGRVFRVGVPLVDGDDNLVGAQPVLRFKIKVGNYYLKQTVGLKSSGDFSNDSDFGNIRLALGNIMSAGGTDITTWLPVEITDEVEWTTVDSFFDLPYQLPGVNQPDVDVIEYDTGNGIEEYPVGMFTVRDDNHANQMRFRNEHANYDTDLVLDLVTPELPTAVSEHTGIEIDCSLRVFDNTGTVLTGDASDENDFGINGNTNFCHGMYIEAFRVMVGTDETDEDTLYFASETNPPGDEVINAGETTLATRPHESYAEIGALTVGAGVRTTGGVTGQDRYKGYWFSQTEVDNSLPTVKTGGRKSLLVVNEEHYRHRANTLNTVAVQLLFESHVQPLLHPTRRVLLEQGTSDPLIQIQGCTHNLMQGVQTVLGYELDRKSSGTVNVDSSSAAGSITKGPRPAGGGVPPGPLATFRSRLAGGGGSLSADDQTKLAAISISGSNISGFTTTGTVLTSDDIEDSSSSHKFATSSQLANISSNASAIGDIQGILKSETTGDGAGVYVDTTDTTKSHVSVTETAGKLQVGQRTLVDMSETSPGSIAFKVQAGPLGSEAQVTAIQITGSSTQNTKATVSIPSGDFRVSSPFQFSGGGSFSAGQTITFAGTTSGIDYGDLDNTPTIPGSPLADANQTLSANRVIDVDGNFLQFKDGSNVRLQFDPNDDRFEFTNGLLVSGDLVTATGGMTSGLIKFNEPQMGGSNGVILRGPTTNLASDVTFVLPDADGTSGQVLQTDGSGNLSFATASGGGGGPAILGNISGRYMWSSSDDGERVHTGNFSYGPFNWYSFSSEPSNATFKAYSASDAVGSTSYSLSGSHLLAYGFQIPTTDKKVKIHYMFRLQNAPASSTWGLSLWGADRQASGSTSSSTTTLRAETADITQSSNSSSRVFHGTLETASDFDEDMALLLAENRSGSLTTTTYMYAQFQIELVD